MWSCLVKQYENTKGNIKLFIREKVRVPDPLHFFAGIFLIFLDNLQTLPIIARSANLNEYKLKKDSKPFMGLVYLNFI